MSFIGTTIVHLHYFEIRHAIECRGWKKF